MTPLKARLLHELQSDARGRGNAISSSELADRVGIQESNGNPETRFEIRDIMQETSTPIGACSEGYFIIQTPGELHEYTQRLEDRISGIEDRIRLVEDAYQSSEPLVAEQATLTDEGDSGEA